MCASRRSAFWPQLVAISLIGIAARQAAAPIPAASPKTFGPSNPPPARSDVTGSIPTAPASHVESRPLPQIAAADDGDSGGGRGMGSYQPGERGDRLDCRAPPPPVWTWEGGTPITVAPGETLETIARAGMACPSPP